MRRTAGASLVVLALAAMAYTTTVACQAPAAGPVPRGDFATVEIQLES